MKSIEKLRDAIKGRTVCIIARGASAKILEERIEEFKDCDVCWASMNLFKPAEDIVEKIGKKLELVSDCSNVKNTQIYEPQVRIPRFEKYLSQGNTLLSSRTVFKDVFMNHNKLDMYDKYKEQIAIIEEVFEHEDAPDSIWDAPPNSITLLFAACIAGGAKKIVVFGYDGLKGELASQRTRLDRQSVHTYYRDDLEREDRKIAASSEEIGSLSTDSYFFERDFPKLYKMYTEVYKNNCEIVNCSPNTMFTVIRNTTYNEVKKELE
jgi:hypothetical protein